MPRGQVTNPVLVAGQIIHFERKPDGELRKIPLRLADFFDVFIQLRGIHPPVVKIVARHWRMVGEADLGQSEGNGVFCVFGRLAGGMAAERRVHVVIWRQRHGVSFEFRVSSFKC